MLNPDFLRLFEISCFVRFDLCGLLPNLNVSILSFTLAPFNSIAFSIDEAEIGIRPA